MDLIYQNRLISAINKPTRITQKTCKNNRYIITNSFVENTFKTAIIKTDVSGQFPIFIFIPLTNLFTKNEVIYQYKRIINYERIEVFIQNIYKYGWIPLKLIRIQMKLTIISYQHFIYIMILILFMIPIVWIKQNRI